MLKKNTNINDFITDPRSILLSLGPDKGFKKYNLNTSNETKVNTLTSYKTPSTYYEYDDSYFRNHIYYNKVNFSEINLTSDVNISHKFPGIDFTTGSEVKVTHNNNLNFNENNKYTLEFYLDAHPLPNTGVTSKTHILSKTLIKNSLLTPNDFTDPLGEIQDAKAESHYPFNIYIKRTGDYHHIYFEVSDGDLTSFCSSQINPSVPNHIMCVRDGSTILLYINDILTSTKSCSNEITNNNANIYVGGGSNITSHFNDNIFSGSICNLRIYNTNASSNQVHHHYLSKNSSPYIGNIFYSHGLISITHPSHKSHFGLYGIGSMVLDDDDVALNDFTVGGIVSSGDWLSGLNFQGSHLIYENEYKCTIDEHEYNNTSNPTVRKGRSTTSPNLANFATGSLFKPYITTIGLYNKDNELLVVGKLGQPIRTSNETDTTIVLRWDT